MPHGHPPHPVTPTPPVIPPSPDPKEVKRKENRMLFARRSLTSQGVDPNTIEDLLLMLDQGNDMSISMSDLMHNFTQLKHEGRSIPGKAISAAKRHHPKATST